MWVKEQNIIMKKYIALTYPFSYSKTLEDKTYIQNERTKGRKNVNENKKEKKNCKISIFVGTLLCVLQYCGDGKQQWLICEHCRLDTKMCIECTRSSYKCFHYYIQYSNIQIFTEWVLYVCVYMWHSYTFATQNSFVLKFWESLNEFYWSWLLIFVCIALFVLSYCSLFFLLRLFHVSWICVYVCVCVMVFFVAMQDPSLLSGCKV